MNSSGRFKTPNTEGGWRLVLCEGIVGISVNKGGREIGTRQVDASDRP